MLCCQDVLFTTESKPKQGRTALSEVAKPEDGSLICPGLIFPDSTRYGVAEAACTWRNRSSPPVDSLVAARSRACSSTNFFCIFAFLFLLGSMPWNLSAHAHPMLRFSDRRGLRSKS